MSLEPPKRNGNRPRSGVLTTLKSTLKSGVEQIGEKIGERIEETRARNRAIREVRAKIKRKELEQKALPIARKYGISIEEAILYIQSEERRKRAQEARKRLTEQLGDMSKNLSKTTALQPTTKKKTQQQKVDIYYEPDIYEPYEPLSPVSSAPYRRSSRQEEFFFEEEPLIEGEVLRGEPFFPPEPPQRRSPPRYYSSYSRVGTPQVQKSNRRQKIDSMVNQIVIGKKKSFPTSGKSTKKRVDEMLKKLI